MADIKTIFSHPRTKEFRNSQKLYDWRSPAYKKDDVSELNRLLKKLCNSRKPATAETVENPKKHFSSFSGSGYSKKQRVILKLSVGYSKKNHKKYIEKYMPQLDKNEVTDKPELFGCNEEEYNAHMVSGHFKVVISPENQKVDLKMLTTVFINKLEELTGYKLYWKAAIHKNTAHPHAHLVINRHDKNGLNVRLARDFIKQGLRDILSNAATNMIGERSINDIETEKQNLIVAPRCTKLDEKLTRFTGKIYPPLLESSLQKRLSYLYSIQLAKKDGELYTLIPNWKERLQEFGRYNSFMAEYFKENGNLELYRGGLVKGIVEKTYTFDKDETWNDAVIINTGKKKFYVPVYKLTKSRLEGKTVMINLESFEALKKISDKEIKITGSHENMQDIYY